jgi:hypothetical protein
MLKTILFDLVLVIIGGLAAVVYFSWTGSTLNWKKVKK